MENNSFNENHIGIILPENIPNIIEETILSELKTEGLNIQIGKSSSIGVLASLEWAIPTLLIAYLFRSYFDGFLKEASKDHYELLKEWLKKFTNDTRAIKINTIRASHSINKLTSGYTQSKAVSIIIQLKSGVKIKLFFDTELIQEDWNNAIDSLLDLVIENYQIYPNDFLTKNLELLTEENSTIIYAVIDKVNKNLLFCNEAGLKGIFI